MGRGGRGSPLSRKSPRLENAKAKAGRCCLPPREVYSVQLYYDESTSRVCASLRLRVPESVLWETRQLSMMHVPCELRMSMSMGGLVGNVVALERAAASLTVVRFARLC